MEQPSLTKESRLVLRDIYKAYLDRRDSGLSKSAAIYFDGPWAGGQTFPGLCDAEEELHDAGYIKPDITGGFELTNKAIIFMENFTKDKLMRWVEFGTQFLP